MSGMFLVQSRNQGFAHAALAGARDQFALHGFSETIERNIPGWHLLHAPHISGGPESLLIDGEDLVAVAGTFTCDGKMGRPALQALLSMANLVKPDWSRLGGQFVTLVHRQGRSFLFTDYFAAFQLFHDADLTLFSTSMLSAAKASPRLSFDPQSVYEFAFNVVPIGNGTLLSELKLLGPNQLIELGERRAVIHTLEKPLPEKPAVMPIAERLKIHGDVLRSLVRDHVGAYRDHLHCPLSGGLDSRLLLAALRAEGCRPNVYVYGSPASTDVRIARAIGAAQGFPVEWIDKAQHRRLEPDAFAEQVARNFHEYDALPTYGGIFENGGNAAARDARHAGGAMSASGGCGEIYRNFFFLPHGPIPAATVARAFFARYSRRDVTAAFDEKAFLRAIEDKILDALGMPGNRAKLPRTLVEQIYPRVRCRSFFGKEISLEGRYGAYLMPFLDHRVVAAGVALPMSLKSYGRFEAMLLNDIDPDLARQPSAYGHDFASPPNLRHRFSEWSTRIRPAWARQRSYALRRRLRSMADEQGDFLAADYMGRVIDLDYPAMRRYFRIGAIDDSGLMRRIACLEYLAGHLGSRLER